MPDLYHSLLGHDLGHLRIVASLWGLELHSNNADSALKEISAALLDPALAAELIPSLPLEAQAALQGLLEAGGRIPWAGFSRRYGEVREMGAGRRDRERPHLKPASAAEVLYYRALLARAFFASERGPQEFAFIPDDLFELLKHAERNHRRARVTAADRLEPLGREATPAERARILPADDSLLEDATTLLAGLRLGRDLSPRPQLTSLLSAAGLLKKGIPHADSVRLFLEESRPRALQALIRAWKTSDTFNELRFVPGLIFEGKWANPAPATRRFLLGLLAALPRGKWWNLASWIDGIKRKHPDFQRPAGDYDSWFIKRASDGRYLRGFACWEEVDGALIRFFITDILHWLGMADLAAAKESEGFTAFRLTGLGLQEKEEGTQTEVARFPDSEYAKVHVSSQGKIVAPRRTARAVRYQIARFCEWDEDRPDEYHYHLTPGSLAKAREQGLKVEHLLALLAKHADAGVPPSLVEALKHWEANGTEARAESQVILRVSQPAILEKLRRSKAGRFLGEPLGPTAVVVKSGAIQKVMEALTEAGWLVEDQTGRADPGKPS